MQSRNAIRQRFPSSVEVLDSSSIGGSGIWSNGNSIEIGSRSLLKNGENGAVRVVFATFNQLDQLLEPATSSRYGTANGTAGTDSTCFSPSLFSDKDSKLRTSINNLYCFPQIIPSSSIRR